MNANCNSQTSNNDDVPEEVEEYLPDWLGAFIWHISDWDGRYKSQSDCKWGVDIESNNSVNALYCSVAEGLRVDFGDWISELQHKYGYWAMGEQAIELLPKTVRAIESEIEDSDNKQIKGLLKKLKKRFVGDFGECLSGIAVIPVSGEPLIDRNEVLPKEYLSTDKENHNPWLIQLVEIKLGLPLTGLSVLSDEQVAEYKKHQTWKKRGFRERMKEEFVEWHTSKRQKKGKSDGEKPFNDAWEDLGFKKEK